MPACHFLIIPVTSSIVIRANFKELFHYVQRLRRLGLSRVEIEELPSLHLPALTALDLSANRLEDLPHFSDILSEGMPQLRELNLSRNQLTHLPAHSWHFMPNLRQLDLSWNPIRVLTKESFDGLDRWEQSASSNNQLLNLK